MKRRSFLKYILGAITVVPAVSLAVKQKDDVRFGRYESVRFIETPKIQRVEPFEVTVDDILRMQETLDNANIPVIDRKVWNKEALKRYYDAQCLVNV